VSEITEQMEQEYLAVKGTKCPYCSSRNIESLDQNSDGNEIWIKIECLDCKKTWVELYKLTGIVPVIN
jgi:TusA-related sulfurtransferase